MGYREIFAKINAGTVKGILIFHGPEEYVKDRTLEALRAKLVAPDMESLNYDLMDSERANAADIRRAVEERYQGATVKRFRTAGHYPYVTRPEEYNAIIRERLKAAG